MAILITGAAGMIGSNLARRLLDKGNRVVGIDNFITGSLENIKKLKNFPKFSFLKHDVTKPLPKKFTVHSSQFTVIYHLACPTGVDNLVRLAGEMILANSLGTRNVLELARNYGAKVVFTSSSEVYGDPQVFPQDESYRGNVDPIGLRSPYEEGKRFSEAMVAMYGHKYGIDARIVRVFNTYGSGMSLSDTRVIPTFLRQAISGRPLTVKGRGEQKRTFCYVDDLVDGLMLVMARGKAGEVYNLGRDVETRIIDLARLVISVTGSKSKIAFVRRPSHDHQRRLPKLGKVKKLGWTVRTGLEKGLRKTIMNL